ncbi:hypothetical protein IWW52_000304 [Coemansia sp. RSA 2704]|nr:hypothetical protein IWW52_000304 [Coemansia sp. RSA 2704]
MNDPAAFGSPSVDVPTPRSKQPAGKQQQKPRFGLREVAQTPVSTMRAQKPSATQTNNQVTRTIKRRPGLFSPSTRSNSVLTSTQQAAELLETEYAPSAPADDRFNAVLEFGCDLDVSAVPLTQLSTAGRQARCLNMPSLEPEELINVPVAPSPQAQTFDNLAMPLLLCKPVILTADALHPTRIPRLKRKR